MVLQELKNVYKAELNTIYNESEIVELFTIFCIEILGLSRIEQRYAATEIVTDHQAEDFRRILKELINGKPHQQILGKAEFYGFDFTVTEDVLVPRPETEELLELAIEKIKTSPKKDKNPLKILDIGTGSGVIPIVLKKYFPEAAVSAIDFSEKALQVAQKNAEHHDVKINFIHTDYLNTKITEDFDVIISNPPYIAQSEKPEIADSVKNFEPEMALFSPTENALIFYEKIAADCKTNLSDGGMVFLEINQKLGAETRDLFHNILAEVELVKDISGNDRMVWGRKFETS